MDPRGLWSTFRGDPTKGQRSSGSQIALEMLYGHQIWWENLKGHAEVSWSQPRVKLLWNSQLPPNLVGISPEMRSKVMQGSSGINQSQFLIKLKIYINI